MPEPDDSVLTPAALQAPIPAAPPRPAGSIRRTSHVDMIPGPDGLELRGAARDLVTGPDGATTTVDRSALRAVVGATGVVTALDVEPARAETATLVGRPAQSGFRAAVRAALPGEVAAGTPLAVLLDDIPVATLISGYARMYDEDRPPPDPAALAVRENVCSGWRADGVMMASVRSGGRISVTLGPEVPDPTVERASDPDGWHELPDLAPGAMRRRRRLDLWPAGDHLEIRAFFRDTHRARSGRESVLHEYDLSATVDADSGRFSRCDAVPRVLPWVECPVAAASSDQLVGRRPAEVQELVGRELRGTRTCTHLNDLLRSLAAVDTLANVIAPRPT